ncbi:hypothetical protein PCK1_001278 [Pneumocystis canis]|nr:hypothetical protein PCK1_001278 [Pneumocystis canis]
MDTKAKEAFNQEIHLSPEEKEVYEKLYREADSENIGVLLGEYSVKFFEKTGLSPQVLAEIWKIADDENMGFLTQKKFNIALRLISHAQEGRRPNPNLINLKCPLPKFDVKKPINWNMPSVCDKIPLITLEEKNRYQNMFRNLKLTNGFIKGSRAKSIFVRTCLPNEILGQIWNLVDVQQRGALNITEFTVAMHLIHSLINGSLKTLPSILPPGIFNMAAGKVHDNNSSYRRVTDNSNLKDPSNNSSQKYHKYQHTHNQSDVFSQFNTNLSRNWDIIKPEEKSQYIDLFNSINKANEDYVVGNEVVSFFLSSKLPEETLAHIWDLADIDKSGKLNREEFIIAMHLIHRKLAGVDLPVSLPQEFMASFLQKRIPQENSCFLSSSNQDPSSSITSESFDLNNSFSLQTQSISPSIPSSVFSIKRSSINSYTETPRVTSSPNFAFSVPHSSHSKTSSIHSMYRAPFVPTSNFGQSIVSSITSDPKVSHQKSPSILVDLLGDSSSENSEKNNINTDESKDSSSKISYLNKQIQKLKQTRASIESDLDVVNIQKHDTEEKLSQIHILYDEEIKAVQKIQENLTESRAITQKLKQRYLEFEKKLYALQNQKQELLEDLEHSKNENIELQHKIEFINNQLLCLKEELKVIEKDSSDQKNITAINKKQLFIFQDNYTKLKTGIEKKNTKIDNTLKNIDSAFTSSYNKSSNPFYQISNFSEIKQVSPVPISAHDDINVMNQSNLPNNSTEDSNKTTYNEKLDISLNVIDNQHTQMEHNSQLLELYNSKNSSLIASTSLMENIIQKKISSNTDLHILKKKNSSTEFLNSSISAQFLELTPGKSSRISLCSETSTLYASDKSNSPKIQKESLNLEPNEDLHNKHNNLEAVNVSIGFKENSEKPVDNIQSKKEVFNMDDLNTTLFHSSVNIGNNSNINLESDNTLHKEYDIEYLNIENSISKKEDIIRTLPGTFPIDSDNLSLDNEDIYHTFNDTEKNIKDDEINKKVEDAFFDASLSRDNSISKKSKANFDEVFTNFVSESEEASGDNKFISKFPPIKDFYNLSESVNPDNFIDNSTVQNKNKESNVNLSSFNIDYNVSYNTKIFTTNENDINSYPAELLKNNCMDDKSDKSLQSKECLYSKSVGNLNTVSQSEDIEQRNEEMFYNLIAAKEVNGFEDDFCTENDEFNTFFIEPFSKEMKNDWINVESATIYHHFNEHENTTLRVNSELTN